MFGNQLITDKKLHISIRVGRAFERGLCGSHFGAFLRLHDSPHVLTAFGRIWVYLDGAGCSDIGDNQQFFVGQFCELIEHGVGFLATWL